MIKATEKESKKTPMLEQYFEIKEQYPDYLLFFRLGDFYELFFDDAKKASVALDITLTKRGQYQGEDVPMCGVPFHAYEPYLAKLVQKGYKVVICEQMESPEQAKQRNPKSTIKRDVVRLVSLGTLTEDVLLDAKKHNYLMVCVAEGAHFGLAWADLSTGDFFTQDVKDIDLTNTLARIELAEIVLPLNQKDNTFIKKIFKDQEEKLTLLPEARFAYLNAKERIEKTFGVQTIDAFGAFSRAETIATGVLIDYLFLTQKCEITSLKPPLRQNKAEFMEIDSATRRSLELFYPMSGSKSSKSLYDVMDKTITNAGGRLFSEFLASPQTNAEEINARLDSVAYFLRQTTLREKLRAQLKELPDLDRALSRLCLQRGGPRDLKAVKDTLKILPLIQNMFLRETLPQLLRNALESISDFSQLAQTLTEALKPEVPLFVRDGDFIAGGYHPKLDELILLRDDSEKVIKDMEYRYKERTGIQGLKIVSNNLLGYYVEVSAKNAPILLNQPELGFIHRQTMLNNVRFTTVELSEVENKLRSAGEEALALEESIFVELVEKIISRSRELMILSKVLALIDVMSAFAELAEKQNYCKPIIDNSTIFEVEAGRHPVVENALSLSHQNFSANDCIMNEENGNLWLLTGPNMAGKSTFLRQNALIAIMAQVGSFVPATRAHIGIIDKIFSRVGASDDLAKGQSTFMVEMVETANILNHATVKSLVILDEIGRGTATFDGLSIAWAVVEYLHDHNACRTLFATHYHELTALSSKLSKMSLHQMMVKDWEGDVIFLHTVGEGAVDKSYGIHVGKLAGLPLAVVKRAEQILKKLEAQNTHTTSIVDDLPLFATVIKQTGTPQPTPAEVYLQSINPDELSPKDALNALYELKKLSTPF